MKGLCYFLQVLTFIIEYSGQKPKIAVRIGIKPINPHQLWKYIPNPPIAKPIIILNILSPVPTLQFI